MEIIKKYTKNPIILPENLHYIQHPSDHNMPHPKVQVSITDNSITLKDLHIPQIESVIILESKDILKLMTWYMGQEKHTQEELISLRKKTDVQENQQIVDKIIKFYNSQKDNVTDLDGMNFLVSIVKDATGKDIKDL